MDRRRALSPSEVNALLPELDRIFERIDALRREIGARANELERLGASAPGAPAPDADITERRRLIALRVTEFQSQIDEIGRLGGIVADVDRGQVDFPSVIDGREVLLCWHRGEPSVTHYYTPGDDLHRQRLPAG